MNAYESFFRDNATRAEAVCLRDGENVFTFADLERESARHAASFLGLGLEPGARIAAQLDSSATAVFAYLGILRAGYVYVPLATDCSETELAAILDDAHVSAMLCGPERQSAVRQLARRLAAPLRVLSLGDTLPTAHAPLPVARTGDDDLAAIVYPEVPGSPAKGVMLSHGNLVANALALAKHWNLASCDVLIQALPMSRVEGFAALHSLMLSGGRTVLHGGQRAGLPADLTQATLMLGSAPFYEQLLSKPDFAAASCPQLRLVACSGPLAPGLPDAFHHRSGHAINACYARAEAGMIAAWRCDERRSCEGKPGTAGQLLPGHKARIIGSNLKPMPFEHPGDVIITGPSVFKGYWRRPEETASAFTPEGWFRTGDVAMWDEFGHITFLGRAEEVIRSGRYTVHPLEVEAKVSALPGVAACAVIGLPDPMSGEAVVAVVEPTREGRVSEVEIIQALEALLPHYKRPKRVHLMEALPRNAQGVVRKDMLRARLQ